MVKFSLLFVLILFSFPSNFVKAGIKVRGSRCTASKKSIAPEFKCFAKSYSRKLTTFNIDLTFTKKLYSAKVKVFLIIFFSFFSKSIFQINSQVHHGNGITPFFNTIINATTDICQFLGGDKSNIMVSMILDTVAKTLPKGVVHSCPYSGQLKAYNITIEDVPIFSQFLLGRYKFISKFFNTDDENIFTLFVDVEFNWILIFWKFLLYV